MGKRLSDEERQRRANEKKVKKIASNLEKVAKALEYYKTIKEAKIHISNGNVKIGNIPNISKLPIATCRHCHACKGDCYACKSLMYTDTLKAWADNTYYSRHDLDGYFDEISEKAKLWRWFRWHVSGDIETPEYFKGMVRVAKENKKCDFLAFTKDYDIVNSYVADGGKIPKNLHIIFSDFESFHCENPYNFPVTDVIESIDELPKKAKLCGGHCETCVCRGVGCWELKKGEKLYFIKH